MVCGALIPFAANTLSRFNIFTILPLASFFTSNLIPHLFPTTFLIFFISSLCVH